jgi:hypothetical protein
MSVVSDSEWNSDVMRLFAASMLVLVGSVTVSTGVAQGAAPVRPNFPHMQLQAQFAGPMQDTIIQRLRDPSNGTICYLYVPIIVQHAATPTGFVQYGANAIGTISCVPGR